MFHSLDCCKDACSPAQCVHPITITAEPEQGGPTIVRWTPKKRSPARLQVRCHTGGNGDTYRRCGLWSGRPAPQCSRRGQRRPGGTRQRYSSSRSGCWPPGSSPSGRCIGSPCPGWSGTWQEAGGWEDRDTLPLSTLDNDVKSTP